MFKGILLPSAIAYLLVVILISGIAWIGSHYS
jgi:hypothetical protein